MITSSLSISFGVAISTSFVILKSIGFKELDPLFITNWFWLEQTRCILFLLVFVFHLKKFLLTKKQKRMLEMECSCSCIFGGENRKTSTQTKTPNDQT